MRGLFISVEGTDGAGKSTQIELLLNYLKDKGCNCVFTREPGGTYIGEKIRNIILDNDNEGMTAEAEALLYAASRAQHVREKIIPAVNAGKTVICEKRTFIILLLEACDYVKDYGNDDKCNTYRNGTVKYRVRVFEDFERLMLQADSLVNRVQKMFISEHASVQKTEDHA